MVSYISTVKVVIFWQFSKRFSKYFSSQLADFQIFNFCPNIREETQKRWRIFATYAYILLFFLYILICWPVCWPICSPVCWPVCWPVFQVSFRSFQKIKNRPPSQASGIQFKIMKITQL